MQSFISHSERETMDFAKSLLESPKSKYFICLYGELGSGKTVFVKGFASALGIPVKEIKSPTYTYLRQYRAGKQKLFHFDFYRINDLDDLMGHELSEIFAERNAWFLIEWPERIAPILPENRIDIHLKYLNGTEREIITEYE